MVAAVLCSSRQEGVTALLLLTRTVCLHLRRLLACRDQVPMRQVSLAAMEALLQRYKGRYTAVVGFQPTGWVHGGGGGGGSGGRSSSRAKSTKRLQRGTVVLYQVSRGWRACMIARACSAACMLAVRMPPMCAPGHAPDIAPATAADGTCAQVPYSEHSSFEELRAFLAWFRPLSVIPSVNNDGGTKLRAMMAALAGPERPLRGPMDAFARTPPQQQQQQRG